MTYKTEIVANGFSLITNHNLSSEQREVETLFLSICQLTESLNMHTRPTLFIIYTKKPRTCGL